jgi:hypothetical protein
MTAPAAGLRATVAAALLLAACAPLREVPQTAHMPRPVRNYYWRKLDPVWWLGNADDPRPPASFRPGDPQALRLALWYTRNPFHNLFFYVIGIADQPTLTSGSSPHRTFAPSGCKANWTRAIGGGLPLPFVSCNGAVQFYAGWRVDGALGFALRTNSDEPRRP